MRKNLVMLSMLIGILLLSSCSAAEQGTGNYSKTNIKIFEGTEAWDLAVAVENQDIKKIEKIAKENTTLLDVKDPIYDCSLLIWAVGMEKYQSAEALLKCGADPNIIANSINIHKEKAEEALKNGDLSLYHRITEMFTQTTALYIASGYSWVDNQAKKGSEYVNLLLTYGADPNLRFATGVECFLSPDGQVAPYGMEAGESPLIKSINCGIEKTKALVEAGADINNRTERGETAAVAALRWGSGPVVTEVRRYAHYLIVEKKAAVTEPYYGPRYFLELQFPDDGEEKEYYPVDILREWVCKLDSEDYKLKMEIVEEFARQGVDYWATEIPQKELKEIQYRYPDTWEEYIIVY